MASLSRSTVVNAPPNLVFAYVTPGADFNCWMHDPIAIEAYADKAIQICDDYGSFAQTRAQAQIHLGWAMARNAKFDVALPLMTLALASYKETGSTAVLANRLTAEVAEAYRMAGQADEGLQILATSPDRVRGEPARFAEIFRIEGELMLAKGQPDDAAAERLFLESIEIAREDRTVFSELRCSTSLARLWQAQGKTREAHDLLGGIYGWFTEGFDSADLKDAKALLDELKQALVPQ